MTEKENIPPVINQAEQETDEIHSEAVCRAVLPPETQEEYEFQLKKDGNRYGHLFKTQEDLEYFSMLPLQPEVKRQVLQRFIELEREKGVSDR